MKRYAIALFALLILSLFGATGCENTQGTAPQTNTAYYKNNPGSDDNQNNGSGAGTAEKPASSGGSSWTDPNPPRGGSRNPYGTHRTVTGAAGS